MQPRGLAPARGVRCHLEMVAQECPGDDLHSKFREHREWPLHERRAIVVVAEDHAAGEPLRDDMQRQTEVLESW